MAANDTRWVVTNRPVRCQIVYFGDLNMAQSFIMQCADGNILLFQIKYISIAQHIN